MWEAGGVGFESHELLGGREGLMIEPTLQSVGGSLDFSFFFFKSVFHKSPNFKLLDDPFNIPGWLAHLRNTLTKEKIFSVNDYYLNLKNKGEL